MPQVLTDSGAKVFVALFSGKVTWEEIVAELWVMLLAGQPPLDRTKTSVADYVTAGGRATPLDRNLDPSTASDPVMVGGRAVVQWGPPGVTFTCVTPFTLWGFLVGGQDDQVLWVDRFATPQNVEHDGVIDIVPAIAITSEYPPLGGST